jgi:hypothetical protein
MPYLPVWASRNSGRWGGVKVKTVKAVAIKINNSSVIGYTDE